MSGFRSVPSGSLSGMTGGCELLGIAVYNPSITAKEEKAHENIIAYYPQGTPIDQQMNEVGLCSAFTGLVDRFRDEVVDDEAAEGQEKRPSSSTVTLSPPQTITTANRRYVICHVERDFYIVVIVGRESVLGYRRRGRLQGLVYNPSAGPVTSLDDDQDDRWSDVVVEHVIAVHRMFSMMYGTMTAHWDRLSRHASTKTQRRRIARLVRRGLVGKLEASLKFVFNEAKCEGTMASPIGVEYVPVQDGRSYLAVSSLMGELEAGHPGGIVGTMVLHTGKVLHSSVSVDDTVTLFHLMRHYTDETPADMVEAAASGLFAPEASDSSGDDEAFEPFTPGSMLKMDVRRSSILRVSTKTNHVGFSEELTAITPARKKKGAAAVPQRAMKRPSQLGEPEEAEERLPCPYIFIRNEPVGVVSYNIRSLQFLILVNEKFLRYLELRQGLLDSIGSFMSSPRYANVARVVEPSIVSSRGLDDRYCYYYLNHGNCALKSSILVREASLLPQQSSSNDLAAAGGTAGGSGATQQELRKTLLQRLSTAAREGAPSAGPAPVTVGLNRLVMKGDNRDNLRRTDMARSLNTALFQELAFGPRGSGSSDGSLTLKDHVPSVSRTEMLIKVGNNAWGCIVRIANREFILTVEGADLREAAKQLDFVCGYVFVGLYRN